MIAYLIDKQALKETIYNDTSYGFYYECMDRSEVVFTQKELFTIIDTMPTVEAMEVVRYQEAIRALNGALIVDNRRCFDGENFPCGYRQWCGLCDENEEYGCAHAYMEWLRDDDQSDIDAEIMKGAK